MNTGQAGPHTGHDGDPDRVRPADADTADTTPTAADPPSSATGAEAWSAYDLAVDTRHSVTWARQALARWRDAGLIEPVGTDSITGAHLYDPAQVRAAQRTDQDLTGS